MQLSSERVAALSAEIDGVKKDHASITAALIQAAKTEKKLGQDIDDISGKLEGLKEQEASIRTSLAARSGVLAEVLGALERMGLNPPPAILVKPEDALSSVRSAILLGAVVPELRQQTEVLIADIARTVADLRVDRRRARAARRPRSAISSPRKQRLDLLLEAKKKLQAETESQLAAEQARSAAARGEGGLSEGTDRLAGEAGREGSRQGRCGAHRGREARQTRERRDSRRCPRTTG